jgi:hypothetical protein
MQPDRLGDCRDQPTAQALRTDCLVPAIDRALQGSVEAALEKMTVIMEQGGDDQGLAFAGALRKFGGLKGVGQLGDAFPAI